MFLNLHLLFPTGKIILMSIDSTVIYIPLQRFWLCTSVKFSNIPNFIECCFPCSYLTYFLSSPIFFYAQERSFSSAEIVAPGLCTLFQHTKIYKLLVPLVISYSFPYRRYLMPFYSLLRRFRHWDSNILKFIDWWSPSWFPPIFLFLCLLFCPRRDHSHVYLYSWHQMYSTP